MSGTEPTVSPSYVQIYIYSCKWKVGLRRVGRERTGHFKYLCCDTSGNPFISSGIAEPFLLRAEANDFLLFQTIFARYIYVPCCVVVTEISVLSSLWSASDLIKISLNTWLSKGERRQTNKCTLPLKIPWKLLQPMGIAAVAASTTLSDQKQQSEDTIKYLEDRVFNAYSGSSKPH